MRGLPPVPPDVVRAELVVNVNGRQLTTGWWWFVPSVDVGGVPWLQATMSNLFADMIGPLDQCMHSGSALSTCRLSTAGTAPLTYVEAAPISHGAHTGGQADAIATGVYVLSSSGGRGSGSRIRIPGCPDDFITDNWLLSPQGQARLFDFAAALVRLTDSLVAPLGGPVVLGTVQRSRAGVPLAAATFDPARGVLPSFRVEILARRLPATRGFSPF